MPNEPVKITAQELEEIKKLPSCQFMLGGTPQTGFFDKVNEKIYYLDSEGNWMVKRARVKKREPEKPQEEEAPAEENGEEEESGKRRWLRRKAKSDVEDESEDGRSRLDALKESLEQPLFEKIPLTRKKLLVIIGGMMVLFIIGSIASSVLFGGNDTPSNPTPIENQEPVDEPDPSLNTIQVIQVKQDLIPGDVITEDVIQSATISAESYNQITLGGTNIYQYNRASSLIGKYATAYIPTGQYLAYNNVASAYTPPKNPWVNEQQGKVYVTAPLDDETATSVLLNFGAKVDMTIKKETVRQTEAPDDSPDIPGMTHQTTIYQSVSIDTYEMQNVIVCDILNAEQVSIYDEYTKLMEIPAGEQLNYLRAALLEDETLADTLTPAYIRIKIGTDQSDAIGDLSDKSISIKYKLHDDSDIDMTTDAKREYAAQARALAETIRDAIHANAETAAEGGGD